MQAIVNLQELDFTWGLGFSKNMGKNQGKKSSCVKITLKIP